MNDMSAVYKEYVRVKLQEKWGSLRKLGWEVIRKFPDWPLFYAVIVGLRLTKSLFLW
jgi:hypothetical protein